MTERIAQASWAAPAFCRWNILPAVLALALALFVSLLPGCGGGGIDLGPFGAVRGQVTYKGKPVTEGLITFNSPKSGQAAIVGLQADGTYRMQLGDRDGLPVGEYNVYVRPPRPDAKARAQMHDLNNSPPSKPKTYPNIPKRYRLETTSGLRAVVNEGDNTFDFKLVEANQ